MKYRTDPTWQHAQQIFISPPGESDGERTVGSIKAAVAMFEVERSQAPLTSAQRNRIATILRGGAA